MTIGHSCRMSRTITVRVSEDRESVEGYERIPQTAEELDWADWTAPEELAAEKDGETRPDRCPQAESYSQVVLRRSNLRAPA